MDSELTLGIRQDDTLKQARGRNCGTWGVRLVVPSQGERGGATDVDGWCEHCSLISLSGSHGAGRTAEKSQIVPFEGDVALLGAGNPAGIAVGRPVTWFLTAVVISGKLGEIHSDSDDCPVGGW